MGEFASRGTANTAVSLGAVGLGLGVLNSGLLGGGGLFGGGNTAHVQAALAEKDAEIGRLQAEKYTDQSALDVRDRIAVVQEKMINQIILNDKAIAANAQEIACLKSQMDLREKLTNARINEAALVAGNGITTLTNAVTCLQNTVNGITKTIVPATAVCPAPMPQYNSWTAPTTTTTTTG